MRITVNVWRQKNSRDAGNFEQHQVDCEPDMSFLEMLDVLNESLIEGGKTPIAFDHDCREGICGMCSMVINGRPHGPQKGTTTCQLHMRQFRDGDSVTIEPWRAGAFPVIKDLVVDRTSLDRIQQAGGYVSVRTGGVPDANATPIGKAVADTAFDYAACIGCGACVAACPNASAMLYTAAKVSHLALLPQGQVERKRRVTDMVATMDAEGFGACTNHGECEAACPKSISVDAIGMLNREVLRAALPQDA